MIYRNFNDGDRDHSLLGFGIMRMPTKKVGEDEVIDYELSQKMVDTAYENGINYFDTAYVYHGGKSEVFLGEALKKYPRESYFLATKLPLWQAETVEDCEKIFNEHLERLQTDYIDYYLFHAVEKNKVEKIKNLKLLDWVDQKKSEGKIRHVCFSFHGDTDCLQEMLGLYDFAFCQLQINYADWNKFNAKKFYDIATKANTPIVVMEPVRGGMLANPAPEVQEILHAKDPNLSNANWAFRFVANLPNVKLILSGMSTMEQLEDNLKTFATEDSASLSTSDQNTLDRAIDILDNLKSIPCTACQYCLPCPVGVQIPTCFEKYNTAKIFGRANYKAISEEGRADNCIQCQQCVSLCPQQIDIPERLVEVAEQFKDQ
ncbi:aldo/keto reductase [Candidatus Epulonipiscium viviparus]|uniref:aldo/keto reductase n=1 Tax=Candidatus Epulonipiscium viviparus TaxID=420336 RepID=UPI002738090A|nr:aldo/keto reductase [Candidatus Epulopiscium viviparus]